jgi:hypothetical protein
MGYPAGEKQFGTLLRNGHYKMCGTSSQIGNPKSSDMADVLLPVLPLIPEPSR